MRSHLSNFSKWLFDKSLGISSLAATSRCQLCDEPAPASGLCQACWSDLPWLQAAQCEICAHPLPTPGVCGRCLADPPHFDRVWAACRYAYPLDALIQSCKYGGRFSALRGLAAILAYTRQPEAGTLVVPMPLSVQRLRERGFNQALELARAAAPGYRLDIQPGCCVKIRDTTAQTLLPWNARRKNIRGAFVVLEELAGRHVVVVDDVLTTGATLNELARCLKKAGAASVTGWVIARTTASDGV